MEKAQIDNKLLGNKRKNINDNGNDDSFEKQEKSKNEPLKLFKNTILNTKNEKELGLLGDLSKSDESEEEKSEKSNDNKKKKNKKLPLFQEKGENNPFKNSSLFSGGSLFSNMGKSEGTSGIFSSSLSESIAKSSLFSSSSPFAAALQSSSFLNSKKEEGSEDDNEEDGEDVFKPSSPKGYDPISNPNSAVKSIYNKKYVKEIESFFELSKVEVVEKKEDNKENNKEDKKEDKKETKFENKYLNKGKGFLSLEYSEEGGKTAIVVFRNSVGNIITNGVLNYKIKKFDRYIKNLKHVAQFCYLKKNPTNLKLELGMAKIPFMREEDLKDFEKSYNDTLELIKTEEN